MAHLANCPHCDHESLVPGDVAAGAWVRCPSCQAFFQLKEARAREIATIEVVEPATGSSSDSHSVQTIADLPSMATWDGGTLEDLKLDREADSEPAHLDLTSEREESPSQGDALDFDDLAAMFDEPKSESMESIDLNEITEVPEAASVDSELNIAADLDEAADLDSDLSEVDDLDLDLDDATPLEHEVISSAATLRDADIDPTATDLSTHAAEAPETPEAAAERIDAWFRSAKTLADIPPVQSVEVDYSQPQVDDLSGPSPKATIEISSADFEGLNSSDDFEIDSADDAPAWDDSQHMDRLLADVENHPRDEFSLSLPEPESDDESHEAESAADEWTPVEAASIPPVTERPAKRSLARTLVMTVVGGFMGLALGYYVLLWIGGPSIDTFGLAHYLPKAILPSSFSPTLRPIVHTPSALPPSEETPAEPASNASQQTGDELAKTEDKSAADSTASPEPTTAADSATQPSTENTAAASPTTDTPATDTTAATAEPTAVAPAEKQASFVEPVNEKLTAPAVPDTGAPIVTKVDKPTEPALFDAPGATPVKNAPPSNESVRIEKAPAFTAADLSAALQAGKDAEAGLLTGKLNESPDIDRAKGRSYMILADLAQNAMFADAASADTARLQQEADELFHNVLATPHARDEVSLIVPKWLSSPKSKKGGIFFAGKLVAHEVKGPLTECNVELSAGQSLPVLLPASQAEAAATAKSPVGVVGWICDDPATHLPDYTGSAKQVIVATKLLPLE
jgi:hypothetical protein